MVLLLMRASPTVRDGLTIEVLQSQPQSGTSREDRTQRGDSHESPRTASSAGQRLARLEQALQIAEDPAPSATTLCAELVLDRNGHLRRPFEFMRHGQSSESRLGGHDLPGHPGKAF